MRVIYAPDPIPLVVRPSVFLAGGIQGCENWQEKVTNAFYRQIEDDPKPHLLNACVYNPRRDDFGELSHQKVREQIAWEYYAIEAADIFSMFFCASDSDQPICMFELGKALERDINLVICVEPGYKREQDVYIQVELARKGFGITKTLNDHIAEIQKKLYIVNEYG